MLHVHISLYRGYHFLNRAAVTDTNNYVSVLQGSLAANINFHFLLLGTSTFSLF